MLMGKFQNSIDPKCRMIIPSKLRDELKGGAILTTGMDKCLYIYPMSEFQATVEQLKTLPKTDAYARAFIRDVFSNANPCEMDKQGRVGIPAELREYAGIEKDLVTVGSMDKIEIWAKEEWENQKQQLGMSSAELAQKMVEYGI